MKSNPRSHDRMFRMFRWNMEKFESSPRHSCSHDALPSSSRIPWLAWLSATVHWVDGSTVDSFVPFSADYWQSLCTVGADFAVQSVWNKSRRERERVTCVANRETRRNWAELCCEQHAISSWYRWRIRKWLLHSQPFCDLNDSASSP